MLNNLCKGIYFLPWADLHAFLLSQSELQWLPCPFTETFTVDDALEAIGFGRFQWKMSLLTGLSWVRILRHTGDISRFCSMYCVSRGSLVLWVQIGDAMEMMILSILGPQLHCEWMLPSYKVALITSVKFIFRYLQPTVIECAQKCLWICFCFASGGVYWDGN